MPGIRIYAFAKKLGLDNKQLLDICEKVGIKGKGSALASLEEDEVAKVEKFLAGDNGDATAAKSKKSEKAPVAPSRQALGSLKTKSCLLSALAKSDE